MFSRLKVYGKKIFLDEVWTTAVDFYWKWSDTKAEEVYKSESVYKNKWLKWMKQTLDKTPEIVGVLYFNRDKTNGLTDRHSIWELDWSILSLRLNKEYLEGLKFFKSSTTSSLAFTK